MATTLNHHWCVGIDLHKDALTACCGEFSHRKIACKCRRQIVEYFAALPHQTARSAIGGKIKPRGHRASRRGTAREL